MRRHQIFFSEYCSDEKMSDSHVLKKSKFALNNDLSWLSKIDEIGIFLSVNNSTISDFCSSKDIEEDKLWGFQSRPIPFIRYNMSLSRT